KACTHELLKNALGVLVQGSAIGRVQMCGFECSTKECRRRQLLWIANYCQLFPSHNRANRILRWKLCCLIKNDEIKRRSTTLNVLSDSEGAHQKARLNRSNGRFALSQGSPEWSKVSLLRHLTLERRKSSGSLRQLKLMLNAISKLTDQGRSIFQ